jgi:hypothetical protein
MLQHRAQNSGMNADLSNHRIEFTSRRSVPEVMRDAM